MKNVFWLLLIVDAGFHSGLAGSVDEVFVEAEDLLNEYREGPSTIDLTSLDINKLIREEDDNELDSIFHSVSKILVADITFESLQRLCEYNALLEVESSAREDVLNCLDAQKGRRLVKRENDENDDEDDSEIAGSGDTVAGDDLEAEPIKEGGSNETSSLEQGAKEEDEVAGENADETGKNQDASIRGINIEEAAASEVDKVDEAAPVDAPVDSVDAAPVDSVDAAPVDSVDAAQTNATAPVDVVDEAPVDSIEAAAVAVDAPPIDSIDAAPVDTAPVDTAPVDAAPVEAIDAAPVAGDDAAPINATAPIDEIAGAPVDSIDAAPIDAASADVVVPVDEAPVDSIDAAPVDEIDTAPVDAAPIDSIDAVETAPVDAIDVAPVDGVDAAPVDSIDAAPVDAAPVDPIDVAPVDPIDTAPVDATPVDSIDSAPVDSVDNAPEVSNGTDVGVPKDENEPSNSPDMIPPIIPVPLPVPVPLPSENQDTTTDDSVNSAGTTTTTTTKEVKPLTPKPDSPRSLGGIDSTDGGIIKGDRNLAVVTRSGGDNANAEKENLQTGNQQKTAAADQDQAGSAAKSGISGLNVFIFFVIAAAIAGAAVFGYKMYKKRQVSYSTVNRGEDFGKELQEVKVKKSEDEGLNFEGQRDAREEKPLMGNNLEITEIGQLEPHTPTPIPRSFKVSPTANRKEYDIGGSENNTRKNDEQ